MTNVRNRRRFGAIRKLPSGRYQVSYPSPTGRITAPDTFTTKRDAAQFLILVEADMARGVWIDPSPAQVTFSSWVEQWRSTTVDLRASTRARDASYLRSMILPAFGSASLAEIDHMWVKSWVADLMASGRAPATVVKAAQILGKILSAAVDAGMLRVNPADRVRLPRVEQSEMRFLSPDEIATLAVTIDPRYSALVLLGAYGGLRAGELFGLRTHRVDTLHRRVEVAEIVVEVSGHHHVGPPKTSAGRRQVPTPEFVAERLADHIATYCDGDRALMFSSPTGKLVRLSIWRRRFWAPALAAAGLDGLRLHDLRHTAVALWIAAGVSPKGIATRAGHRSVATVLDRYGHLLEGAERQADDELDRLARGARQTPSASVAELG